MAKECIPINVMGAGIFNQYQCFLLGGRNDIESDRSNLRICRGLFTGRSHHCTIQSALKCNVEILISFKMLPSHDHFACQFSTRWISLRSACLASPSIHHIPLTRIRASKYSFGRRTQLMRLCCTLDFHTHPDWTSVESFVSTGIQWNLLESDGINSNRTESIGILWNPPESTRIHRIPVEYA